MKNWDILDNYYSCPKLDQFSFSMHEMGTKIADSIANSVDSY